VVAQAIPPWLAEIPAAKLADHLIGGIATQDLPKSESSALPLDVLGGTSLLIPPNTLFQRDPSCWIYDGVSCNPMFWPARHPETLLQRAIYRFHPRFNGGFKISNNSGAVTGMAAITFIGPFQATRVPDPFFQSQNV
jgi:arginine deiminase